MSNSDHSKMKYVFKGSEPQAIKNLILHLSKKAKGSIKENDNLGKIVANLAKGKVISTKENALSATFSVDLTEVMESIQEAIKEALLKRFKNEDEEHPMTMKITENEIFYTKPLANAKPRLIVKTKLFIESRHEAPFDKLTDRLTEDGNDELKFMSIKFRMGETQDSSSAYKFMTAKMDTKSSGVPTSTRKQMESADDKLDSMIFECLDDELKKKLSERIEQADKNDEDTSKPGQFALNWLKTKYNVEQLSSIETVGKYMEYLSTVKTSDQNLHQFAEALKDKLSDLHDSQWSMTDLYLVLVLAHSMKSTDVDKRGEKVDYSKITKRISEALSKGEKLEPSTIIDLLQTENAVSKSALKLVASGTSAEALNVQFTGNAKFNQFTGKAKSTLRSNGSNGKRKFDKSPPAGFGFTVIPSCLWCAHCAQSGKHNREGWNGWNEHSVTNCKAHLRSNCPFEKRNKSKKPYKNSDSLEAKMASLTSLVTELVKSKND
jgi:hypothetical protein